MTKDICLITGANQGIGLATATKLASEYGYHVLLGARNEERGKQAAERLQSEKLSVEFLHIDVTDQASVNKAKSYVEKTFGHLDVLVNNAGVALKEPSSLVQQMRNTFEVNVFGAAAVTEAFTPLLQKSANGRIVFVSSGLGSCDAVVRNPQRALGLYAYNSSKGALNRLGVEYGAILGKSGIKVNLVDPGYIATNLNNYARDYDAPAGQPDDGAVQIVKMATIGKDGPSLTYTRKEGTVAW